MNNQLSNNMFYHINNLLRHVAYAARSAQFILITDYQKECLELYRHLTFNGDTELIHQPVGLTFFLYLTM